MKYAPLVRILLRYGAGGIAAVAVASKISPDLGERLAADPDLVMVLAGFLGAVIEGAYMRAKRKGGAT